MWKKKEIEKNCNIHSVVPFLNYFENTDKNYDTNIKLLLIFIHLDINNYK